MKTLLRVLVVLLALSVTTGCAVNRGKVRNLIVERTDPISIGDQARFNYDVEECTNFAVQTLKRINREMALRALAGAAVGAAAGYSLSKAYGAGNRVTGGSALLGSMAGAAGATGTTMNPTDILIYNCMTHRGYLMLY